MVIGNLLKMGLTSKSSYNMWTTVTNFIMPYISKYLTPVLVVACIVLGFIVWNQDSTITDLNKKLVAVETKAKLDLALYNSERALAKSTIDKQNSDIEKYKFDLAAYERTVNQKEKELQAARFKLQEQVNNELAQDSSAENQLKIMTRVMKDFSDENN